MAVTFINVDLTHGCADKAVFEKKGRSISMPITGFVFSKSGRLTLNSTDPNVTSEVEGCLDFVGVIGPKVLTLGHTGGDEPQWSASFELSCIDFVKLI